MNRTECLIFLKNQERTESIVSIFNDKKTGLFHVRFAGSEEKEYSYRPDDVRVYKPEILNPDFYTVDLDGKPFSGLSAIYRYADAGYWYLERRDQHYLISDNRLKTTHSALENKNASTVLSYLKEVSFISPIKDEDGNYRITGRIKDMIIRGGENIYPREIEEFLYQLPGVKDVQVAGIPSKKYGEAVGAFIILHEGVDMHESDVRDFCIGKISRYKIPKYIFFVNEFPMTGSGKIQKFKLKDLGLLLFKEQGIEII